jgi:nitroreductase
MNETLNTIAQRYSCRAYDGKLPEKSILEAIAAAGVQVPCRSMKYHPRIVVITNKAFIEEMDAEGMRIISEWDDKSLHERFMSYGCTMYYNAPCMFLILKKPGADIDTGIVSQTIALAATSLGLGNVVCGMAGFAFDGAKGELFRKRAGFTEEWAFGMAILVGYADKASMAVLAELAGLYVDKVGKPHEPDMSKISFVE